MTSTTTTLPTNRRGASSIYARLEDQILTRDQIGASEALYDLLRAERPALEIVGEAVRIHAPYTQIPYHQRIDDGLISFVNNDHCLLSARVSLRLQNYLEPELSMLPLAQTVWYIPSGLDPWNQLLGRAPGHYARISGALPAEPGIFENPPPPDVHWEDQEPLVLDGTFEEKRGRWLTYVEQSEVVTAYRVFLDLIEDEANRPALLAELAFAGLINVQDRMLYNRSYTTGHKAYRARATIELGEALGWERAHSVVYAGVPDMAVGPHWHSTYEMASNVCRDQLDNRDAELLDNVERLTPVEAEALIDVILHEPEPAYIDRLTALLLAGKGPREILDVVQIASAQLVLETGHPNNFSMSQHGYEYCNTLRWFYDKFNHQHRLKLLYVAASFINRAAHHQAHVEGNGPVEIKPAAGAESMSAEQILRRIDESIIDLNTEASVAWTSAYLSSAYDPRRLITTFATAASKFGNDPHNQELALCFLEDYLHSSADDRERLLLACAHHTAGHRKYGDPLEAYRRFASAFGIDADQSSQGSAPAEEALLDD